MVFQTRTAVVASGILLTAGVSEAQWSRCTSALEELRLTTQATHEVTNELSSMQETLGEYEVEYRRCLEDRDFFEAGGQRLDPRPQIIASDGCRQPLMLHQTTETRYATSMEDARYAFDALALAVQAVERTCEYPLAAMVPAESAPGGR